MRRSGLQPCRSLSDHRAVHRHCAVIFRVFIVGGQAHNMALYGIAIARALGVQSIDFLDDNASRLGDAQTMGARAISETSDLYPIVVDCGGEPEHLALALSKTGPDGVCTPVWPYVGSHPLPVGAMFMRNVTLVTGQPHAQALMTPVLQLMQDRAVNSELIPVEVLPWELDQKISCGKAGTAVRTVISSASASNGSCSGVCLMPLSAQGSRQGSKPEGPRRDSGSRSPSLSIPRLPAFTSLAQLHWPSTASRSRAARSPFGRRSGLAHRLNGRSASFCDPLVFQPPRPKVGA